MFDERQLKRLRRWAHNNASVACGEDGLPQLDADTEGYTTGPRQMVQGLLRHIEELERERKNLLENAESERSWATRATSDRRDANATAILPALYADRETDELKKSEIAEEAYVWAAAMEEARGKKP